MKFLFVIPKSRWIENSHNFFTDLLPWHIDYLVISNSFEKEFINTNYNSKEHKGVIFWGEIFDQKLLEAVRNRNLIFIPSCEIMHLKRLNWWYRLRQIKIISFSEFLTRELNKHQFRVLGLKYYEPIQKNKKISNQKCLNIFTDSEITPKNKIIVEKLFKKNPIDFHKEIQEDTHIYLSLKKYEGLNSNIFKALSMGKVLVGNNCFILNEYVKHNVDGYLYRTALPLSINFSNLVEIQERSIENVIKGARKWMAQKEAIQDFLLKK